MHIFFKITCYPSGAIFYPQLRITGFTLKQCIYDVSRYLLVRTFVNKLLQIAFVTDILWNKFIGLLIYYFKHLYFESLSLDIKLEYLKHNVRVSKCYLQIKMLHLPHKMFTFLFHCHEQMLHSSIAKVTKPGIFNSFTSITLGFWILLSILWLIRSSPSSNEKDMFLFYFWMYCRD